MNKVRVVFVALSKKIPVNHLMLVNYNRVSPLALLTEDGDGKFLEITKDIKVQILPFSFVDKIVEVGQNCLWLVFGSTDKPSAASDMKKFLSANGVPEANIVNFELLAQVNPSWLANIRFAEEGNANCFATGDDLTVCGLDFKNLPEVKAVNLSAPNQDLRQSFRTAQHVFQSVKRGTIKFVFIGLAPYCLHVDSRKNFSTCANDFVYTFALRDKITVTTAHDKNLAALLNDNLGKFVNSVTSAHVDSNFDKYKAALNRKISVGDVTNWKSALDRNTRPFDEQTVTENLRVLESYIKLCLDNGAKPIGILFPFATVLRENFNRENLFCLRRELARLEKIYDFTVVDMFDAQTTYDCFRDMTHMNPKGSAISSVSVDFALCGKKFFPVEQIARLNYEQLFDVSNFLPKDVYNATVDDYFASAVKRIRAKKKIRVAFVSDDPSMYCGDALYNMFATNPRCETTFFLCLQKSLRDMPLALEDFNRGLDGFKSRGINVVGVTDDKQTVPAQDLLIFLRPYFHYMPKAFELSSIGTQTLMAYIPYGFNTSNWNIYDTPIHHVGWKLFFDTKFHINLLENRCRTGMPRGLYSGYTKLDAFYQDTDALKFDWKVTRPDAKKIIWAPHWSIASGIFYATFQHNYKFMYEFAKAHPEISWVVKPHPMLFASAAGHGVFESDEAFKKYLQAWDDLPNAKVFTGPYYQGLFATSDGMIMDCGSWIGEYQYTHKPMIFLTRDTQRFNDLGNALMKILYRVDGRDLNGIAAAIQKIFVDGNDDMFDARMKFFDEHMNYIKDNGMTASEFIFKTIAKEFRL